MRKAVLLIFIGVLFVHIVSASYSCSDGNITVDSKVINAGELKSINNLNIALLSPSYGPAAEILVDTRKVVLTNTSSSEEIKLLSGDYQISLVKINGLTATINLKGDKEEIEVNTVEEVGGLQIYALQIAGTYPGEDARLELFAGKKYAFLYANNLTITQTISDEEYLTEVLSSSNSQAMIRVYKCENGNIIQVDDIVKEITNPSTNFSFDDEINNSVNDSSNNKTVNPVKNITDLEGEEKDMPKSKSSFFAYIIYFIPTIILIIIGIVYYIHSRKY